MGVTYIIIHWCQHGVYCRYDSLMFSKSGPYVYILATWHFRITSVSLRFHHGITTVSLRLRPGIATANWDAFSPELRRLSRRWYFVLRFRSGIATVLTVVKPERGRSSKFGKVVLRYSSGIAPASWCDRAFSLFQFVNDGRWVRLFALYFSHLISLIFYFVLF